MATALSFLKGMSEKNNFSDFNFYEEMEWRIVFLKDMIKSKYINVQDSTHHIYRVPATHKDIQLVIFPDELTKQMAIQEKFFEEYFKEHIPMMTTVADCKNF